MIHRAKIFRASAKFCACLCVLSLSLCLLLWICDQLYWRTYWAVNIKDSRSDWGRHLIWPKTFVLKNKTNKEKNIVLVCVKWLVVKYQLCKHTQPHGDLPNRKKGKIVGCKNFLFELYIKKIMLKIWPRVILMTYSHHWHTHTHTHTHTHIYIYIWECVRVQRNFVLNI